MKFKQNLSLLLWLYRGKASKDGKAPIYLRITIDGLNTDISLGKKIHPDFWDGEAKQVRSSGQEAKMINQKIMQVQTDLQRHFMMLQAQFERVTPAMLKNVYLGIPAMQEKKTSSQGSQPGSTLLHAFDEFIATFEKKTEKGIRSSGTLRHWRSTRKKVETFIAYRYHRRDLDFSEIDHMFADEFYDYLTLHQDSPLSEVTAKKQVKWTRQIVKIGVKKKVIASNPLEGFVCSGGNKEVQPLELYEVETIYQKEISIDRIAEVRDAFIFQCFTGFAYQDMYNLTPDNIVRVGRAGEKWLIKDRGKTDVTEMVPILPIVQELIDKYKNHSYCKINNRLIPVNSNYRYNVYLKELAVICGIRRDLNTHLARHTFADIMLNSGVPLEDVGKMLGHRNIRTTQRYARVRKNRISENMAKVKGKLFTKSGKLKAVA
ncbi:site-specific integrase [Dyadobacter sp. CY345]|uniref:site-specific integrase n=1 Tax=Dyadobacter sp. CY345 TaxID=2909335 RepID=UPI001F45E0DA|nr:site-specific integrase [Dyadobacter sp. CY345]MCF2446956.1 site-specific integrase [Dyadobacter sp. CY345]